MARKLQLILNTWQELGDTVAGTVGTGDRRSSRKIEYNY